MAASEKECKAKKIKIVKSFSPTQKCNPIKNKEKKKEEKRI